MITFKDALAFEDEFANLLTKYHELNLDDNIKFDILAHLRWVSFYAQEMLDELNRIEKFKIDYNDDIFNFWLDKCNSHMNRAKELLH